jgi:hypothetical protein
MPRFNPDFSNVSLPPPCPPGLAALAKEWDCLIAGVMLGGDGEGTRFTAARAAAIVERRIQEAVAVLK